MFVELPLSNFVGEPVDIVQRLYNAQDMNNPVHLENRADDYDDLLKCKPVEGYKPTRIDSPSYIWDKDLIPIFGSEQVCILSNEYKKFLRLKDEIEKVPEFFVGVKNEFFHVHIEDGQVTKFIVELYQFNDYDFDGILIDPWQEHGLEVMDWRHRTLVDMGVSSVL
jgi:hypothetical protein